MNEISVFPHIKDTHNPTHIGLFTVLERIKTGGDKKELIEHIRTLEGDEYKKAKRELPLICFGGTFGSRSKDGIINGSGIMPLDFDEGTEGELNELRKTLETKQYTIATFSSPRSRGRFKALIRIPVTSSDEEFKKYFAALKKEYKTIDPSGKDISRAAFFTYDPNIYINENATVWDVKYETPKQKKTTERYTVRDWDSVTNALKKIEEAEDGYKHLARTKIAYLMGGWISAKQINYQEAMKLLEDAVAKNTTDFDAAMKTVKDCVQAGMNAPLNMSEQREVLKLTVAAPRRYKPMSEVWDDVQSFYETGYKRGWDIGFNCAKEYISILEGSTSYVYAAPAAGKTQVYMEILMNITIDRVRRGEDFYNQIFTPETGDVAQVYGELISIHAKKSFVGKYKMSEDEMKASADFVSKYFLILDYEGDTADMKGILTQVEAAEREFGIHINTVTIDPLNYLSFDEGRYSRRDLSIAKDLDLFLADARKNKRHNCIITHARDQQAIKNNDGQWYYPLVSPRMILDGQQFFRKGMLMISIYRPLDIKNEPLADDNGYPAEQNETQVWIQKAKPKGCAKVGMFKLFYDFKANRYYEKDEHGREFFAWGEPRKQEDKFPPIEKEIKPISLPPVEKADSLKANTSFDENKTIDDSEEETVPF